MLHITPRLNSRLLAPIAPLTLLAAMAVLPATSRGAHLSALFTREDGMNAVRLNGDTHTLRDLIARRELAPRRFDANHGRMGRALALGEDGLLTRYQLNPARFRRFHPLFAYLLDDVIPDDLAGPTRPPGSVLGDETPLPFPTPTPEPSIPLPGPVVPPSGPPPGGIAPAVIPEPGTLALLGSGLAVLAAGAWATRRRGDRSAKP